tara:strand:+ start:2373 stop:2546 length:174 start_codon:yes stop_codon:yes gene_type:complete
MTDFLKNYDDLVAQNAAMRKALIKIIIQRDQPDPGMEFIYECESNEQLVRALDRVQA